MSFAPFALEEWQSRYETEVQFNLADSGVQAVTLEELVPTDEAVQRLLQTSLHYPPVNGTRRLRELIAVQYRDANPDNILVTVGAAEANAVAVGALVQAGDHVVVMEPGYRQIRGMAINAGCKVDAFHLCRETGWRPDLDHLEKLVRPDTRLIAVTNPHNPVGTILTAEEMKRVVAAAELSGAWLLADEVYRGTERLANTETESFLGLYPRTIAVGSMSKAYGLPGLRLGWLAGPAEVIEGAWRRHEYATIATGALSMVLSEIALAEPMRTRLIERRRALIPSGSE